MRLFHGMMFLGAVDREADRVALNPRATPTKMPSESFMEREVLRWRLEKAIDDLGGLQQGPTSDEDWLEIEDTVHDIAAALLGRRIVITEQLPYPPSPPNLDGLDKDEWLSRLRARCRKWVDAILEP